MEGTYGKTVAFWGLTVAYLSHIATMRSHYATISAKPRLYKAFWL